MIEESMFLINGSNRMFIVTKLNETFLLQFEDCLTYITIEHFNRAKEEQLITYIGEL